MAGGIPTYHRALRGGFQTLSPGATANDLSPAVGDANTSIPEYKAFLGNIRKA
ncbi:MAG: hypothetical protein Q8N20_04120 [Eubacteriales bacterium]|nr:hypothetical protein [Eubacteriales bacterium]MDZ7610041.1 hypothetical protein [Eubacteriales bacterium]